MARYLFITWDGSGNLNPTLGLAQALRANGHDIALAGYELERARVARHGFRFSLLERSNAAFAPPIDGDFAHAMVPGVCGWRLLIWRMSPK